MSVSYRHHRPPPQVGLYISTINIMKDPQGSGTLVCAGYTHSHLLYLENTGYLGCRRVCGALLEPEDTLFLSIDSACCNIDELEAHRSQPSDPGPKPVSVLLYSCNNQRLPWGLLFLPIIKKISRASSRLVGPFVLILFFISFSRPCLNVESLCGSVK